jgi:hypothetical protein
MTGPDYRRRPAAAMAKESYVDRGLGSKGSFQGDTFEVRLQSLQRGANGLPEAADVKGRKNVREPAI